MNDDLDFIASGASSSWTRIDDKVTAFKRWLRENDLVLTSADGQPPADIIYRIESFFAGLD
jgi:hypothetical protein